MNQNPQKLFGKKISIFILTFSFTFILLQGLTFAQDKELVKMQALGDTLFKTMSIEELKKIQQEYTNRVDKITREEEKIRGKGLEVTESFMEREGKNIEGQDNILIRLAEYYIEEADDAFDKKFIEFEKIEQEYFEKLELFDQGKIQIEPTPPEFPKKNYDKVISIYDKILNEYAKSEYADDALYSKAFLLQQMDQGFVARRIYQEVIDRYPDSHFAAESYMRLAEFYFDPRDDKDTETTIVELQKAIRLYKKVLNYRDSKRYDEALYKLGWSYYRLSATDPKYYSDAIIYFLAVVDDITRAEKLDPKETISNPNVKQEAIQYIGISFSDEDTYAQAGVKNARKFIERIGGREYGVYIMRSLGETYQKIENNERAIEAYTNLLDMYPFYEEAPLVMQNINNTYYSLGRDEDEYNNRYELFRRFNPKSEWYAHIENSELPDKLKYQQQGHKLSEKALYTNLILDFQRAEELETKNLPAQEAYVKLIKGCEEYLEVFAADSNAYDINWSYAYILDAKLNRFSDAYEQYIHVSNDYLETAHQEEAAYNAIFVADTLMAMTKVSSKDTSVLFDISNQENMRSEVLTVEEKRAVEAYDNYIRLFPEGQKTPIFLASAGALYFNHKQFAEAKVYFNTLIRRFPGAKEKTIAMRSIMDSYFALGKFRDSEFIAKRILGNADIPDEEKIFAKQRLALSIYKNARLYQDQGQFMEAAEEYRRVYEEAPDDTNYVDASLFNSGLMFDKIKEWEKALDTYKLLAEKYPDSKYALNSLQNAAEDYKELKQYASAGNMYEQIFELNRDKFEIAEPMLSNASFYYNEGEDWQNAIRVNNLYISTYPDQDIATDLYFANAGHYLKLDNLIEANRIYEEFATKYPTDSRSVEAFYRRGAYYKEHDQANAAKVEFNKAIQKSEQFSRQGMDPNRYYVGEALNSLVAMQHDEFNTITLKQPESNINAQQDRLKNLITEIIDSNRKIISNGSIRSFEAVYKSAEVYELFADKYNAQERKQNLDAVQLFAENKRINESTANLYDKAVDEYKTALKNIPLVAEKFEIDMFAEDTVVEQQAEIDTSFADTSFVVKRAVKTDSTKDIALNWYRKANNKVSYLLYKQAAVTGENVKQALATENPQTSPIAKIIFQLQVIQKIVTPAIQQTINAYQRNITEAEEMGVHNKYVEESKRQILLTSNETADELEKLTFVAIKPYPEMAEEFMRLVALEYGTTNNKGEDYPLINSNMAQLIDLSKTLAVATLQNYSKTLDLANEQNVSNDLVRTTANKMLRFAYELSELYEVHKDSAEVRTARYAKKFETTEEYNYDDASVAFQDQTFNFQDYEREILDYAFQLKTDYEIDNIWGKKILARLIQIDPATYAGNIEKEKYIIESDDNWLYETQRIKGYINIDFDDSSWKKTGIVASTSNQFSSLGVNPKSMWIARKTVVPDSADTTFGLGGVNLDTISTAVNTDFASDTVMTVVGETDTLQPASHDFAELQDDTMEIEESDTVQVYFRKIIDLDGTPVDGNIYITADNDFRFFLNGEYIIDDAADSFAKIDTIGYGYISFSIKPGKNILAIHAMDIDRSGGGVKLYGHIELLPLDVSAAAEQQGMIMQLDVDPVILKRINTLNKNRISLNL